MKELFDLFWTFCKIGALTFGGGYAMLPLIQREIVENKKWSTEKEILDYYAVGQCTPGVIAVNTATFIGYKLKGIIGGILDGVIPRDRENYYLKIVYDEIDRLARLVNDLLDISAMESGKFNLAITEFDINQVISLCILNLEHKIKEKGLNVKATFHDKRAYVLGDRDRIIQVVTNIIENAIKYSNDDGEIKIDAYSKGEKIYVDIFNSGKCIDEKELNKIWDRFYKSDKSRTNKLSTGLGLPIVRSILSQHNEDIWVKNIEGKGVSFIFTLKKSH